MAKLNPLHTPDRIERSIKQYGHFDLDRCTGRTTAAKLDCLRKAIESPFTPVFPRDHKELGYAEKRAFVEDVKLMADTLGLTEIYVSASPSPCISFGKI